MKNFKYTSSKNAFTMLELVFVIVVIGIIAAVAMPRLDRDRTQEAADTILSDIRYAQHMALTDFVHHWAIRNWQRAFWQFRVESCASASGLFIHLGSDKNYGGDIDRNESAYDPSDAGLPMFWTNTDTCTNGGDATVSKNIFITKLFGVTSIVGSGGCAGVQHIGFDHLGRPHVSFSGSTVPNYATYMTSACTFTFTVTDGDNFAISIQPETGFAQIVGQNES